MAETNNDRENKNTIQIVRPLGPNEAVYAHMVKTVGVGILFQIGVVDTSKELSIDDVREAGRILASRQEALRLRIAHTNPDDMFKYSFARMDNWDEIQVRLANLDSKDDWVSITNEESNRVFDFENGPLWGITLASVAKVEGLEELYSHRYVVMMKIHHAICDAKSAFDVMYRQYLPILSAVINKGDPSSIIPEDIKLKPPCEKTFGNAYLPWYIRCGLTAYRWFNRNFRKQADLFLYEYQDDPARTKEEKMADPGHHPFVFPKEVTTGVLNAAKRHGVTVHCILLGANTIALSATCADAGVTLPKNILQGWTMDARKFVDWGLPQPLCVYTSTAMTTTETKHDHTKEEFWEMCSKISSSVRSQVTKDKCAAGMGFSEYCITSLQKNSSVTDFFQEIRMVGVGIISNVGNCDVGPEPKITPGDVKIKLVEQYFAVTGLRKMNVWPFFHGLSTFNGQIMWNMSYNPNTVSKRFIQNYVLKIQEVCEKYCLSTEESNKEQDTNRI